MKMVKVKTDHNREIFINLDRIDYISLSFNTVNFTDRYVRLDDESMKKLVDLIEGKENDTWQS